MNYTCWDEVKHHVKKINPKLYEIIDEINPDLKIQKIQYNYGDMICDQTKYYQKSKGFNENILDASEMPLLLLMDGMLELYMEFNQKVITYDIYKPGDFFPYSQDCEFEFAYPSKPYSIYFLHAGLRNISILPMVEINTDYLQLAEMYNINPSLNPEINSNQYLILKELIKNETSAWNCNLLAFDKHWKHEIKNNIKYYKLKEYMKDQALLTHKYRKSSFYADYVMRNMAKKYKGMRNQEYIFEVIKNIILTSLGDIIGFAPVTDDVSLPKNLISDKFIKGYGEKFTPAIIAPYKYNYSKDSLPVYYSLYLNNDTIHETKSFQPSAYMEIIHNVIDFYLTEFANHELTKSFAFGMMKDNLTLKYYAQRGNRGDKNYLSDASKLLVDDIRFKNLYDEYNTLSNYHFPKRSNFMRALISIDLKNPTIP
ncbi:hypothetical protein [Cysteiniphilum marinum]|uniref:hypothetical protein n=1 Tax=Cysteiniphilum marinum TaxID=2774191 RepID=UPI00193B963C|nr:hypothetical protein [Cysteiniphilum marinum]